MIDLTAALSERHRGPVIGPRDAGYDRARTTFNALIDARPAVITRPTGADDVATAISFAIDQGRPVSVRGGGHSVAGHSVGDGSVMIDLRLLRQVHVDSATLTAEVEGGCCWNDVDASTQAYELAMPGGTYGDTGVAGLTLTGGIGHLIGAFGLTLDNLASAEVVTASGDVVTASPDREPELFWALRGGGGNFGVVTSFRFRVHRVPLMTGGVLVHRLEDAGDVLRAWVGMQDAAQDELTCMPALSGSELVDGRGLLTSVAFIGPTHDARGAIAPLLDAAAPTLDTVGPMHYSQVQGLYAYMPFGLRNYWTGRFTEQLPDDVIAFLVDHYAKADGRAHNTILFEPLHGAASRVDRAATAFAYRNARFNISPLAVWEDPAMDQGQIEWAKIARDRLQDLSAGGYLNYASEASVETVAAAFGAEAWARLRAIKTAWDPDNVFRFNHNIPPA